MTNQILLNQKLLSFDSCLSLFLMLILKFFYIKFFGLISYLVIFFSGYIFGIIIYLMYFLFSKTDVLNFHLERFNRLLLNLILVSILFVLLIKFLVLFNGYRCF